MPAPRIYNVQSLAGGGGGSIPVDQAIDEIKTYPFSFNSPSPINLVALEVGSRVLGITIKITESFNGTNASLTVGKAGQPDFLMNANQNIPQELGDYASNPYYMAGVVETLQLFVSPDGSTQGQGVVVVKLNKGD